MGWIETLEQFVVEYGGLAVPDVGRPDFVDLHTMIVWSLCDVLIARKPGVWKRKARNYLSRQRSELELIERSDNPYLKELRILCSIIILVRSRCNISASYHLSERDTCK